MKISEVSMPITFDCYRCFSPRRLAHGTTAVSVAVLDDSSIAIKCGRLQSNTT